MQITSPVKSVLASHVSRHQGDGSEMFDLLRATNRKEPLIPHSIPGLRWEKVAVDIMSYQGHEYIVVVDFYSIYPEIAMLERKTAVSVIMDMKSMFARRGIPGQLVSDNVPFASREFNDSAKEWGIKLTTSSPMYPQSNGQSERAVQTMKNMLKKANAEGRDPNLELLTYRNTAVAGMCIWYSPAQMLMSRSLNTRVSTLPSGQPGYTESCNDRGYQVNV